MKWRARRLDTPFCAALLDIDKFKTVNDSFGNAAGDAVLRMIGAACTRALRASDHVARYGGEEIAILLPDTDLAQAGIVLDRVRREIMAMIVPELSGRWVVTASIGAAQLQTEDTGLADMLGRAMRRFIAPRKLAATGSSFRLQPDAPSCVS